MVEAPPYFAEVRVLEQPPSTSTAAPDMVDPGGSAQAITAPARRRKRSEALTAKVERVKGIEPSS